jgi:3-hydroxyacyl-CoA dehydrogenase
LASAHREGTGEECVERKTSISVDLKATMSHADFVQENGAERPDFKIKLFAEIDAATPTNSIIESNSSGITMSVTQSAFAHPERCVIGHPFTPPHMVPLVELKEVQPCLQALHVS